MEETMKEFNEKRVYMTMEISITCKEESERIIKNKEIVNEWRKDSNLYYLSLRNFFSGNTYYMNDMYINAVNNCDINLLPASIVLNKLISLNVIENDTTKKYDLILINTQMKLFDILFDYSPSLFAKEICKLIQSCYKINNLKKFYSIDYCIDEKNKATRKAMEKAELEAKNKK